MTSEPGQIERAAAEMETAAALLRGGEVERAAIVALDAMKILGVNYQNERLDDFGTAYLDGMQSRKRAELLHVYSVAHECAVTKGLSMEEAGKFAAAEACTRTGTPPLLPADLSAALFRRMWSWVTVLSGSAWDMANALAARYQMPIEIVIERALGAIEHLNELPGTEPDGPSLCAE